MKKLLRIVKPILAVALIAGLATAGFLTREFWPRRLQHDKPVEPVNTPSESAAPATKIIVGDQAQKDATPELSRRIVPSIWLA